MSQSRLLTNRQIIEAFKAFTDLSGGYEATTKLANGEEKNITKRFRLGDARYAVLKNLTILRRERDRFQKAQQEFAESHAADVGGDVSAIDKDPKRLAAFRKDVERLLDESVEVKGLLSIGLSKFPNDDATESDARIEALSTVLDTLVEDDTPVS